jgi:hypothetical protein
VQINGFHVHLDIQEVRVGTVCSVPGWIIKFLRILGMANISGQVRLGNCHSEYPI